MTGRVIRIGTRGSQLALAQAHEVQHALELSGIATEIVTYKTLGDRVLDRPLSAIGDKGLFTAELERDLLDERIDCAVHSLKDLPTADPLGLAIVAMLEREDSRDALVVARGFGKATLDALPNGARVGTSSLRRRAQLRALYPHLDVRDLRGNVGTRLKKVDDGEVDAAILASAGLHRLGLRDRIAQYLDAPQWLSAAGQGTIAIQARLADVDVTTMLSAIDNASARETSAAERALLSALEGGCQVPIGAACTKREKETILHAMISTIDGAKVVRDHVSVDALRPEESGRALAAKLRANGGEAILAALREAMAGPL